ncbi:MAG: hypothetical protein OES24_22920 [Acidimicrobiia bacterium]|nr:hypothetical protein [Acidimicrobiia bacterium]
MTLLFGSHEGDGSSTSENGADPHANTFVPSSPTDSTRSRSPSPNSTGPAALPAIADWLDQLEPADCTTYRDAIL